MAAEAFIIEELTGQRRSIVLRGRALPYRGVKWPGEQRHRVTWYAGNPQATLQVLGPQENQTQLRGTWKDRFIRGMTTVQGFDEVRFAEDMVAIFHELRRSGNLLRVQWGREVRRGILAKFSPQYDRPQDIAWEATFTWIDFDVEAPRAAPATSTGPELVDLTNELDDTLAFRPSFALPGFASGILGSVGDLRIGVSAMFDLSLNVRVQASLPIPSVQASFSVAARIRVSAEATISASADVPIEDAIPSDDLNEVIEAEQWRMDVAHRTRRLQAHAIRQAERLRSRAEPGVLDVVAVPGETTLRHLALVYYGNADDWQQIADVNSITGSAVPAGTVVVIPPPNVPPRC